MLAEVKQRERMMSCVYNCRKARASEPSDRGDSIHSLMPFMRISRLTQSTSNPLAHFILPSHALPTLSHTQTMSTPPPDEILDRFTALASLGQDDFQRAN